jgi:16S rRNA processing protein RimM
LPLPQGEYYQSDLIGFEVVKRDGRRLGRVRDWLEQCGPALLDVEGEQGEEMLIPFAASICVEIDTRGKRIVVELPEGLEDLNR